MLEKVRIAKFDVWFFRVIWIGLLGVLTTLAIWTASIAINIAMSGGEGAGRKAGVFLAIQAAVMLTLAWAAVRTPRQWRELTARAAADATHVATSHYGIGPRMVNWLKRTWQETDPAKDVVPSPDGLSGTWSMIDDRLRGEGWDAIAIKKLRDNPRAFPNTLRRFGFSFGRVRGNGCAARTVGAIYYLWSRLASTTTGTRPVA